MAKLPLTVCLIVRNEVMVLSRCLESVVGMAQEIVVVDTGSTDETREIAASYGARVIDIPWADDFSAARNVALEAATQSWLMMLDADEWLPPESVGVLTQILPQVPEDAVIFGRRLALDHGVHAFGVMLWPRAAGLRYRGRVHEVLDFADVPTVAEAPDFIVLNQRPDWDDGKIDERVAHYAKLLDMEMTAGHRTVEILLAAGKMALGAADGERALALFDQALAHPDCYGHLAALVGLRRVAALTALDLGEAADRDLRALCVEWPEYLDAHLTAAMWAHTRQDWPMALDHGSRALRLIRFARPQFHHCLLQGPGDILVGIAEALARSDDHAGAEKCLEARAAGEGDPVLLVELQERLMLDVGAAWRWYVLLFAPPEQQVDARLQTSDPADTALVRAELIAFLNRQLGLSEDVLSGLVEAAGAFPDDIRLPLAVSHLMVARQDWQAASEWIGAVFDRGGSGGELEINRGLVDLRLGHREAAVAAFQRAMADERYRVDAERFLTQIEASV